MFEHFTHRLWIVQNYFAGQVIFCFNGEVIRRPEFQIQQIDWQARDDEIAARLLCVRDHLKLTQGQFASQLSITRDRVAAYEDGRTPLRCDVGIRLCRHFFVNELWLACGSIDAKSREAGQRANFSDLAARLTVALAAQPVALTVPPGIGYAQGFEKYLMPYYLGLAAKLDGFPKIAILPNDRPEYLQNALACAVEFWRGGLTDNEWSYFFDGLISMGNNTRKVFLQSKPGGRLSGSAKKK